MAKVYKFKRKDRNRYRKVYRYIRKKPSYEYCTSQEFELVAGFVTFSHAGATSQTYTYPSTVDFTNVPVITVTAVETDPDGPDVNAFVTSITVDQVVIEVSAPFTGQVHFVIVGQD